MGKDEYGKRIEEIVETPVDIISTGPDREDSIILRNALPRVWPKPLSRGSIVIFEF